jgi:hypothetical protein
VVDPTASQFPHRPHYEELDLTDPEDAARVPSGICMDCGADVYGGATFCSERCERATIAYLKSI